MLKELVVAVFQQFPFTKWTVAVGLCLIIFGGHNAKEIGLWLIGAVATFMVIIAYMVMEIDDEEKKWRMRRGRK